MTGSPATNVTPAAAPANKATTSSVAIAGGTARHLVMEGNGWAVYGDGAGQGPVQLAIPANATAGEALATVTTLGFGTWCGWSHCSLIIYRGTTKTIADAVARYANASLAVIATAFALACSPLGGIGAVVCGGGGAIYGSYAIDQFIYARAHNMCISLDYLVSPATPYNVRPLNDSNCHN